MDKTEKKRYQYITAPATVVAAFVALAWLVVSWTTLNNRVQNLEDFKSEVNIVEIQKDLQEIKVNISWIQKMLSDMQK